MIIFETVGKPYVRVPVLSNTTVSILFKFSMVELDLIKIPFFVATPVATTIARGVARPKAQGQATTKTVTKVLKAIPGLKIK